MSVPDLAPDDDEGGRMQTNVRLSINLYIMQLLRQ